MKNILISNSFAFMNDYIQELKTKEEIVDENIYYLDFLDEQIGKAISLYLSNSIFDEKKIVLLKNSNFLNRKNVSKNFNEYFNAFLKSISKNFLFFQVDTLAEKETFYEKISPYFSVVELTPRNKKLNSFSLEKYLNNKKINFDKKAIRNLMKYVDNNFEIAINEINKILLIEDELTLKTIDDYVIDLKGESFFKLLDAIIKKRYSIIENIFVTALSKGIAMIVILESLLSDLELMINIKLFEKFHSNKQFNFSLLKIHPFRINNLKINANQIDLDKMIYLYENLLKFEEFIKKSNPDYIDKLLYGKIIYLMKNI